VWSRQHADLALAETPLQWGNAPFPLFSPLVLGLLLLAPSASAQGTERVLIVGDSWAEFTWVFGSLDRALDRAGHGDKIAVGDVTALGGTTAEQWVTPAYQALITSELAAYPTIDVIHLSLGGNDFLGAWNASMTSAQEQVLFDGIADDIEATVQFIHGIDPNIQIVVNGYDYVNFDELRVTDPWTLLIWFLLGTPTSTRINQAMFDSSATMYARLANDPTVHFINHAGLMQWVFGYPSQGIAPRTTALPGNEPSGYRPALGGIPTLPSPPEAMLDAIHLNRRGYDAVTLHCTYYFYDAWFDANP
jgi:lysophospholipase L1-like esterase